MKKRLIITEEQFKKLIEFKGKKYYQRNKVFLPENIFLLRENNIIEEAVFKTYDINFVIKHFCEYLNFANDYKIFASNPSNFNGFITTVEGANNLSYLELVVVEDESIIKKVENTLSLCGYYKSFCETYCNGYLQIGFEKIHDNEINIPFKKIYHVTKRENKIKIDKIGLVPKQKNKKTYHLERIYFFTEDFGEKGFYQVAKQLFDNQESNFGYIVYEIDTNKLKNVDFHYDVNTKHGIYTTSNIPPEAMKIKYEYKK